MKRSGHFAVLKVENLQRYGNIGVTGFNENRGADMEETGIDGEVLREICDLAEKYHIQK